MLAASFVIYQQYREKKFKIELLNTKLQDYNERMSESLADGQTLNDSVLSGYVAEHHLPNLRVTIIKDNGDVVFDNMTQDYSKLASHKNRKEVADALKSGSGYDINRLSSTLNKDYFYSATYFSNKKIVIRSALPYDSELAKSLKSDKHYLWFTMIIMLILTIILYRFVRRLGNNVYKLQLFAQKARNNESLETEELVAFSDDELGEIAEKIVTLYKQLQKTKQEQTVLKRQLTQNIAHELKTPVASIKGYLETIIDNPSIDQETKRQFIDRCYAQTLRLTSLLQDISILNRLDDAPEEKQFVEVNINQIVDNVIKETALDVSKKEMTFVNNIDADINVMGNASMLYSIFRNLMDNAILYAGVGKTISLSVNKEQDYWHFIFKDNGVGVDPVHLERIFERFYRVDKGRSRKMGGTGLGLAIVKNAVLLHGGSIKATNVPTGGLQFDFTLRIS